MVQGVHSGDVAADDGDTLPLGWRRTTIAEVADVNPSTAHPLQDDDQVSFVPMAAVTEQTNEIDTSALKPWRDVKKGYTRFVNGDVIFAKITPCMENGKIAVVRDAHGGRLNGIHCIAPQGRIGCVVPVPLGEP